MLLFAQWGRNASKQDKMPQKATKYITIITNQNFIGLNVGRYSKKNSKTFGSNLYLTIKKSLEQCKNVKGETTGNVN